MKFMQNLPKLSESDVNDSSDAATANDDGVETIDNMIDDHLTEVQQCRIKIIDRMISKISQARPECPDY